MSGKEKDTDRQMVWFSKRDIMCENSLSFYSRTVDIIQKRWMG